MQAQSNTPALKDLTDISFIDENGQLPEQYQGKIGVYAIFDAEKVLQFVGYSRNIFVSLKQCLVRQPQKCYWLKTQTIERPSRSVLENIEKTWIEENGSIPAGNGDEKPKWTQPIDAKLQITPEERANYENPANDEIAKMKILKNVARRVEAEILQVLEMRGLKMQVRFNPKLKEEGLLDLK
ncbi:GIY-YIG nuclease family protein [Mastigocoleus sp. MO_188.B34]|uniref:GIY-YIG nuclease family protein n=1 Tax=Mastigocoleus sp. MO_188.B34 TaxID=3036635 RepID=UPI0026031CF3|nr:GIY-YIG nuclease family protein [Mastigocoleus sp. MO_188.B34]MDJ0692952.1 GIY-YIG nuclease family protein [Mastigocoleus sp. MO_188.B34]